MADSTTRKSGKGKSSNTASGEADNGNSGGAHVSGMIADNGSGSGGSGQETQVLETVKSAAGDAAGAVQEKAGEVVDTVKEQAATQLTTQKDRIAGGIGSLAEVVRRASGDMRGQEQFVAANYTEKAADRLEMLSAQLQYSELPDIVHQVEHFARRQPLGFLAGGFALGLVAARFLKSTARRPEETTSQYSGYSGYSSGYSSGTEYMGESGIDTDNTLFESSASTGVGAIDNGVDALGATDTQPRERVTTINIDPLATGGSQGGSYTGQGYGASGGYGTDQGYSAGSASGGAYGGAGTGETYGNQGYDNQGYGQGQEQRGDQGYGNAGSGTGGQTSGSGWGG